jgi:hypothetical protein
MEGLVTYDLTPFCLPHNKPPVDQLAGTLELPTGLALIQRVHRDVHNVVRSFIKEVDIVDSVDCALMDAGLDSCMMKSFVLVSASMWLVFEGEGES